MHLELTEKIKKTFNRIEGDYGTRIATPPQKKLIDITLDDWGFSQAELDTSPDRWDTFCDRLQSATEMYMILSKEKSLWTPPGSNKKSVKIKKRRPYRKTFERRFHLVEFVVHSWARDNGSRIDWERVTAEWNKAHPYDQFEKSISLKSLYNKAIREEDILDSLLLHQVLDGMAAVRKDGQSFENQLEQFNRQTLPAPENAGRPTLSVLYEHFAMTDPIDKKTMRLKGLIRVTVTLLSKGIMRREAQHERVNTPKG